MSQSPKSGQFNSDEYATQLDKLNIP